MRWEQRIARKRWVRRKGERRSERAITVASRAGAKRLDVGSSW